MVLPTGYMKRNLGWCAFLNGVLMVVHWLLCAQTNNKCLNFLWIYMAMGYILRKIDLNILRQERLIR